MGEAHVSQARRLPALYCYLWPGLPQAWFAGRWSGLAMALGFAGLLNLVLLGTLVWTEWFGPLEKWLGCFLVVAAWGAGVWSALRWREQAAPMATQPERVLYPEALSQYLQRNWFAAENVCHEMVRGNAHDVDARLLLATLWRHTGRLDDARRQLDELDALEGSEKWSREIGEERRLLDDQRMTAAGPNQARSAAIQGAA